MFNIFLLRFALLPCVVLAVSGTCSNSDGEMSCGGPSAARPADDESRAIAEEVKPYVIGALGGSYDTFELHSYKTQVVAGVNYFLKIRVANASENFFIHCKVYSKLPHMIAMGAPKNELTGIKKAEDGSWWRGTEADELNHF